MNRVYITYTSLHSLYITGINSTHSWPAPSKADYRTSIVKAMGSNPVEASEYFLGFFFFGNCFSFSITARITFTSNLKKYKLHIESLKVKLWLKQGTYKETDWVNTVNDPSSINAISFCDKSLKNKVTQHTIPSQVSRNLLPLTTIAQCKTV